MTPEQALNILNQVSSQALLSRDNHEKVLVAVDTRNTTNFFGLM